MVCIGVFGFLVWVLVGLRGGVVYDLVLGMEGCCSGGLGWYLLLCSHSDLE